MPRFFASPSPVNRRSFLAAAGAVSLGATLSACGGSGGGSGSPSKPVGQADIDKAMKTPTELTFWTWVPNIAKEVALFEQKYPAVKVKVVNAGQGTPQYTKLRTALKAGSGAPDLVQIEFQAIPTFTITNSLLDLGPYGASALKDKFVGWTRGQVSGPAGEVWAIPQDTGPMGMLYREDIFDRHGIQVPTTWDEFAAAARKLHKADPNVYRGSVGNAVTSLRVDTGSRPLATGGSPVVVRLPADASSTTPPAVATSGSTTAGAATACGRSTRRPRRPGTAATCSTSTAPAALPYSTTRARPRSPTPRWTSATRTAPTTSW